MQDLISNFSASLQISSNELEQKERKKVQKLVINSCKDTIDDLKFTNIIDRASTFLIKIKLADNSEWFELQNLSNLINSCKHLSIVLLLVSKSFSKFQIAWKLNNNEGFKYLKPYTDKFGKHDEEVHEFIANFLAESLSDGHLGIKSVFDTNQVDIYQIADSKGATLLTAARKIENSKLVTKFESLKLYLVDGIRGPHLQTLAIKYDHFDAVYALYEEDIPIILTQDTESTSEELDKFFQKIEDFHNLLATDQIKEVKKAFYKLPRSTHCINLRNQSALKSAAQNSSFECYQFLLERGIRPTPGDHIWDGTDEDPDEMDDYFREFLKKVHDKHVDLIMSKSVVYLGDEDCINEFRLIKKALKVLNTNRFIRSMIMLIAESKDFKLIYDFSKDDVECGQSWLTGRIYIGAKQLLEKNLQHKFLGNLTHKLCHRAMYLVYRNEGKPYSENDKNTLESFDEIAKNCQKKQRFLKGFKISEKLETFDENSKSSEQIAKSCENFEKLKEKSNEKFSKKLMINFEKKSKSLESFENFEKISKISQKNPQSPQKSHAELIAWTVQNLAKFLKQPAKMKEFKKTFKDLVEFFEKKVMLDINKAIPEVKIRGPIEVKSVYIYHELSDEDQAKIQNGIVLYKGVKVQLKDLFPVNPHLIYRDLRIDHMLYLIDGQILDFSKQDLKCLFSKVKHTWNNLAEALRQKILNSNLNFQNKSLLFSELLLKSPKSFDMLTSAQICVILDEVLLNINEVPENKPNFYVERTFLDEKLNRLKIEDAIHKTEESRMFILSSEPGTGKSTIFRDIKDKIKEQNPAKWVSIINLKDRVQFCNKIEALEDIQESLKDILGLRIKTKFENSIFDELYESGDVILLWDGFDEVPEGCREFLMELMLKIHKDTKSVQFLSTRPLFCDVITSKLKMASHTLTPFAEDEKIEFLTETFKSAKLEDSNFQNFIEKFHKIVDKLTISGCTNFNTPLMLQMIGKWTSDQISNSLSPNDHYTLKFLEEMSEKSKNIWNLYENFVNRQIKRWKIQCGLIHRSCPDDEHFEVLQMYHKYALKSQVQKFQPKTRLTISKLDIITQNYIDDIRIEDLARMKILYVNNSTTFEFSHPTFEEFFVAQFLIDSIYRGFYVEADDIILIIQLLIDVFKSHETKPNLITKFIHSYLDSSPPQKNRNFHSIVTKCLVEKFRFLFFDILRGKNDEIADILFKIFRKNYQLLVLLLHVHEDETVYTALNGWERLKELAKENLYLYDFERFLNGKSGCKN